MAHNLSVNHSADACSELSVAHDMSREDMAMCGELLVAHDSGGESHGELHMACDARNITQREPIGSSEHCHPEKDDTMHGEPPPYKANDLLVMADTDDGPREALPPHGSTRQSSEHVEASAPWLRRQINDVNPQEHRESIACGAWGRVERFRPMCLAMQCSEHHWCLLKHTVLQGMTEIPLTGHLPARERNRHGSNPIPPHQGQMS